MSRPNPPHEGPAPDAPSDVRALSPRPNLEHERKQAKKLLALLHNGDPAALARVHAKLSQSRETRPDEFQLSDAQFTVAREYGFTSWPRLVEYFQTLARHEVSGQRGQEPGERQQNLTRSITRGHAARLPWTAAALARFVPRFYGRTAADIFASEITSEEAQLVAARMHRFPSWEAMLETVPSRPDRDHWRDDSPRRQAFRAIRARDLGALTSLMEANPELLKVINPVEPWASSIIYSVIHSEMMMPRPEGLELSEWLTTTGLDLAPALNWLLLGHMRTKTSNIQWLLDHGADPEWVPPNGISVLEHALYRYWNGEAVDLVARRVRRREALWIAAGVGDATAVKRYFDTQGRLTNAARENRPDFTAMGPLPAPPTFGDEDVDILWEAFLIAAWNERYPVMDVLLGHGLPIDYSPWGQPLIEFGIFEQRASLVEYFVTHGAKVDARLREAVEEYFAQQPADLSRRRILELCGGRDAEVVRREYEERRSQRVMQTAPEIEKAFVYAKQDAVHAGVTAVSLDNLFVGLLREDGYPVTMLAVGGVDLPRLRQALGPRFELQDDPPADMTGDADCTAIMLAARKEAEERKNAYLTTLHVFKALLQHAPQSVLELIQSSGGSMEKVVTETDRTLSQVS